jgi:hypothetical protein
VLVPGKSGGGADVGERVAVGQAYDRYPLSVFVEEECGGWRHHSPVAGPAVPTELVDDRDVIVPVHARLGRTLVVAPGQRAQLLEAVAGGGELGGGLLVVLGESCVSVPSAFVGLGSCLDLEEFPPSQVPVRPVRR